MSYANNKGADQPAHPRSLISTFVVRCLDSIIPLVSISKISRLYLASVAGQFECTLVTNPKDRFSRDKAQILCKYSDYRPSYTQYEQIDQPQTSTLNVRKAI